MREELVELWKWFYHLALAVVVAGIVRPLLEKGFSWYSFGVSSGLALIFLLCGFFLIKVGRKKNGSFHP